MSASAVLKKYLDDETGDYYFNTILQIFEDAEIDLDSLDHPEEFVKLLQDNAFINKESLIIQAEVFAEDTGLKPKKDSLLEIGTMLRQQEILHPKFISHAIGYFEEEKAWAPAPEKN